MCAKSPELPRGYGKKLAVRGNALVTDNMKAVVSTNSKSGEDVCGKP